MKTCNKNIFIAPVLLAIALAWAGLVILKNTYLDKAGLFIKENNGHEALQIYRPLAHLGVNTAQRLLGYMYAFGIGNIPKDDEEAIYWFRRCGPDGEIVEDKIDPAAPHELVVAKAYATGDREVRADRAESIKWLKRAAAGGSKEAAEILAQNQQ